MAGSARSNARSLVLHPGNKGGMTAPGATHHDATDSPQKRRGPLLAAAAYCQGHVSSLHVRAGFAILGARYGRRLQALQHRYWDKGAYRGGLTVSDAIGRRPGRLLFGPPANTMRRIPLEWTLVRGPIRASEIHPLIVEETGLDPAVPGREVLEALSQLRSASLVEVVGRI
jgi:hypothetical protein